MAWATNEQQRRRPIHDRVDYSSSRCGWRSDDSG